MKRGMMNQKKFHLAFKPSSDAEYISSHRPLSIEYKNINGPIIEANTITILSPDTVFFDAIQGKGQLGIPSSDNYFGSNTEKIEISNYNKSVLLPISYKKYILTINLVGTSNPYLRAGIIQVTPYNWPITYNNSAGYGYIQFKDIPYGDCNIYVTCNQNFGSYSSSLYITGDTTINVTLEKVYKTFVVVVTVRQNREIYIYPDGHQEERYIATHVKVEYIDNYGSTRSENVSSGYSGETVHSFVCLSGQKFNYSGSENGSVDKDANIYIGGETRYIELAS